MPQTPPPAPAPQSHAARYLWWIAAIVVLVVGGGVAYLKLAGANADYICTKVITTEGACTNGTWGTWEDVSSTTEGDVTTTVQRRTYTGTRATSKTLTYLSGRTTCAAGYSQGGNGTWNAGWSGFHGGNIVTTASACQITQTQTLTITQRSGGSTVRRSTANVTVNTGSTTQSTREAGSLDEIMNEDTTAGGDLVAGDAQVDITAQPSLLRSGNTSTITWNAAGVRSCTVTSTGGDSWTGTSGSQTSKPITQKTTFTATCSLGEDAGDISGTVDVNIVPSFQEN